MLQSYQQFFPKVPRRGAGSFREFPKVQNKGAGNFRETRKGVAGVWEGFGKKQTPHARMLEGFEPIVVELLFIFHNDGV